MPNRQASTNLSNYRFDEEFIGRINDDSALTMAHPDDTVLIAGPPRYILLTGDNGPIDAAKISLFGSFQSCRIGMSQTDTMLKAIGSSEFFRATTNNPISIAMDAVFANGDNLLKVLYNNFINYMAGDDKDIKALQKYFGNEVARGIMAFSNKKTNYFTNLSSPIYSIPFGLGIIWANKLREIIGSIYIENVLIRDFATAVQAGATVIMESVTMIGSRLVPMDFTNEEFTGDDRFNDLREQIEKYLGIK